MDKPGDQQQDLFHVPDTSASVDRRDDKQFLHDVKRLIEKAETMRVRYMNKHQLYKMVTMTVNLLVIIAGASGFCWFLLMDTDLAKALGCIVLAVIIPIAMNTWLKGPLNNYLSDYKSKYLPELAELMGGFSYHPERGIAEKIIRKTGVAPNFSIYEAEDCFRGKYKGTKVLFSEATLKDKYKATLFRGLLVLVEIPNAVFEGHTIITADRDMAETYEAGRWQKLSRVPLQISNPEWDRFIAYSDKPDAAALILGDKFIKELSEADTAFGAEDVTAVLFRGKYVFIMIPHEEDMFEASDLYIPIATQIHAAKCKKEVDQLLELIDVFELYSAKS